MQEEIEHKTVNFAISTTKLSARTLLRGMQFLLRQYDKHASQGKQSMKRLVRQNRGVTNVEIQKTGIKDFDRYAKRYHIDYPAWRKTLSGKGSPTSNRQLNTMRCTTQHSAGNAPTGWSASMHPGFFRACTVSRWRWGVL